MAGKPKPKGPRAVLALGGGGQPKEENLGLGWESPNPKMFFVSAWGLQRGRCFCCMGMAHSPENPRRCWGLGTENLNKLGLG